MLWFIALDCKIICTVPLGSTVACTASIYLLSYTHNTYHASLKITGMRRANAGSSPPRRSPTGIVIDERYAMRCTSSHCGTVFLSVVCSTGCISDQGPSSHASQLRLNVGRWNTSCVLAHAPQLPEILFGNNALELHHKPSGFLLQFEARGALKGWVKLFTEGTFEASFILCNVMTCLLLDTWFHATYNIHASADHDNKLQCGNRRCC